MSQRRAVATPICLVPLAIQPQYLRLTVYLRPHDLLQLCFEPRFANVPPTLSVILERSEESRLLPSLSLTGELCVTDADRRSEDPCTAAFAKTDISVGSLFCVILSGVCGVEGPRIASP